MLGSNLLDPTFITAGPDGALWFTALGAIGRITTSSCASYAYYPPNPASTPTGITAGPDGALWFADSGTNSIGRITTSGSVTEYPLPTAKSGPQGITAGPDGALWFTEYGGNNIGRITTSGSITEYPLPTARSQPYGITAGPDGALWFTELRAVGLGAIGRITTSGSITEYPNASGYSIASGPDGALWFAGGGIGRITTSGSVTEYPVPTTFGGGATGITAGPDGALWFTVPADNHVGRIATSGLFSYYVSLPGGSQPYGITTGPDGALWFTNNSSWTIGRYAPGPPPPAISSLSPTSVTEGGPGFTLTVNGSAFAPGAVVDWNGSPLSTTYVSNAQLTASVPAGFIAKAGTVAVTVVADGFASGIAVFTVNGPAINFLNPASTPAGGPAFTLTVDGSGFASGAAVNWNSSPLSTSYVSATQLTAAVPASLIATAGTAMVTVILDGVTSNSIGFTVNQPPVPAINSLSPASAPAGGPAFTLTIGGSGFVSGAVANWNGSPLSTTYVSDTRLAASVPASLITSSGTAYITVSSPGGASNNALFLVDMLAINTLNPPNVPAGGPAFTLTLSGSGFNSGAVVNWNGSPLPTTFLGPAQIAASVPASLIDAPGTAAITVALSTGASTKATLTVTPPANPQCTNIGGNWSGSESGSASYTIVSPVETDVFTNGISGTGATTIAQTGCLISYNPIGISGLIGSSLTMSQLASLTRTGVVSGSSVSVVGLLALVDTVETAQAGFIITSISSNTLAGTGQVAGNVVTVNGTGKFQAAGVYLMNGQTGQFTMTITTSSTAIFTRETLNVTSVGNGASFTQSFAPGMLMSVFGTALSTGSPQTATTVPLPLTSSSGTFVTINGITTPLLYISSTQINLQIPYELAPGAALLTVNAGGQSASISLTIQAAAPGIFVDSNTGHMVPNESASAGSTIGFFLTGAGQVTPAEATGNVPAQGTTPVPDLPLTMTVGGIAVTPVYVGIPDWSVGVLQINFTVPSTLAAGTYPVIVTIGGVASQSALLTVTSP